MVKNAFTLIELIFAIVVIAISVISLPMMTQVTSKGIEGNIQQEAIFGAATQLNEAVTAHWDENSLEPNMPDSFARVIDDGTCDAQRQKIGHINQTLHRRCLDSATTGISSTASNDDVIALEDMARTQVSIFLGTSSEEGYKEDYTSSLDITSNESFGSLDNNPNIKKIRSTVYDKDGTTIATLETFVMNIGEIDYLERDF